MSIFELEPSAPATLLGEGQAPPAAGPAPPGGPPEPPPTVQSGGWSEEKTKSVIGYAWQKVIGPGLQYGLGAQPAEFQLQRLELEVLTVLVQASLNRHVPLLGDSINPDNADRALIFVVGGMLLIRVVNIYMRRGRIGPLSAEERAAAEQPAPAPPPDNWQVPRSAPRAGPAAAAARPPAPSPSNGSGPKSPSTIGGQVGDGRSYVSRN